MGQKKVRKNKITSQFSEDTVIKLIKSLRTRVHLYPTQNLAPASQKTYLMSIINIKGFNDI
jgi:hypothetical protein